VDGDEMSVNDQVEKYIDHEVRIRMQEHLGEKLNRKLNFIMAMTSTIILSILFPIIMHALKLA
jgi:hypothetical protein